MAGQKGKAGRPRRPDQTEPIFLTLSSSVLQAVWRCKVFLESQAGVPMTKGMAIDRILAAGCAALAPTTTTETGGEA